MIILSNLYSYFSKLIKDHGIIDIRSVKNEKGEGKRIIVLHAGCKGDFFDGKDYLKK